MRNFTKPMLLASILVAGVASAPSLYAQGGREPSGSTMDHGMMRDGKMGDGMMGTMKQMSKMIDHCSNMMSDSRPNDQWRKNSPSDQDK